jgi:hypothetical protein
MNYFDTQQHLHHGQQFNPQFNPQSWAMFNPQHAQHLGWAMGGPSLQGIAQAAYGQQPYGQSFGQPFGPFGYGQQYGFGQPAIGAFGQQYGWGGQPQWWGQGGQHQRQLSPQDVSEVVRQLVPALPHILAQAQQPQLGYAAYGQFGQYGQGARMLTQQDVHEVVRQILPILPQIVGALQGQPHLQHAAMYGSQWPLAASWQQPFGQQLGQFGQYGMPQFQAAFGGGGLGWGQQRQLTQQDVAEVTRQLVGLIPQVIGNLQALNQQQRMI